VEKELGKGEVLYHAFLNKTEQEKEQQRKELEKRKKLRKEGERNKKKM